MPRGIIYASDYGWVPGVLNMAAAQAAVDAALATGKTLVLGNGTYLIDVDPNTGTMLHVAGDGTGSLTIVGSGDTHLQAVTPEQTPEMILVENIRRFELRDIAIDGNRSYTPGEEGATIRAAGVHTTTLQGLDVTNAMPIRVVSTPDHRADTLIFGDLTFDHGHGSASLFTKRYGIEHIVQTGPVTVHDTSGGFTFDSDPIYGIDTLLGIANEAGAHEFTLTFAAPHGRQVGDWIEVRGANEAAYNGRFQIVATTDGTVTVSQALTIPTTQATGNVTATAAWGPIETTRLGDLYASEMTSGTLEGGIPDRGQVRTLKLEDGVGRAVLGDIVGVDHYANSPGNPDRSGVLLLGAGAADLPIHSLTAGLVSGTNVGDVVRINVGRDDFGTIEIGTLYASEARNALVVAPLFDLSAYAEGHGAIGTLRIGHLVLAEGAETGIRIDDSNNPLLGPIIHTLVIGRVTNTAGAPLMILSPGAIENIIGGKYADAFTGSTGGETIHGRGGRDILRGDDGDDVLFGNGGGDVLYGDGGHDTLTGGRGVDAFIVGDGDTVTDFDGDRLNVRLIDADDAVAGDQKFRFIEGSFTGHARELHAVYEGGNTLIEGDTNGDRLADFVIALNGLHSLTAADFAL